MKILVLSDSHSRYLEDIHFEDYDYVFHCGDYGRSKELLERTNNLYFVAGNCDWANNKEVLVDIFNKKVYMTHGDLYHVKMHVNSLIYKALENKANICLYGHTHQQALFIRDNILFINPGAYEDGSYVIIDDNCVSFYYNDVLKRKFDYKW